MPSSSMPKPTLNREGTDVSVAEENRMMSTLDVPITAVADLPSVDNAKTEVRRPRSTLNTQQVLPAAGKDTIAAIVQPEQVLSEQPLSDVQEALAKKLASAQACGQVIGSAAPAN